MKTQLNFWIWKDDGLADWISPFLKPIGHMGILLKEAVVQWMTGRS